MKIQLATFRGISLSMMGKPSGHVWHFEVPEGGAKVFLLTVGGIDLKPVRAQFSQIVRVSPGVPHVVLAPGKYWARASATTIGLEGQR